MNAFKKATASLIMAVLILAIAAPAALAAPGSGPGEKEINGGGTRPNKAHQGHAWDEENPAPNPVNPPEGGPMAPKFGAETVTVLLVTVYGDANADGVRDGDENGLENVFIELQTATGSSVRFLKTDENGQVVFLDLVQGAYVLDVRPPAGWQPAEIPVEVLAGETTEVEVGLKPASTGG